MSEKFSRGSSSHDGGVFRQFDYGAQEKPVSPMRSIAGDKHIENFRSPPRLLQAPSIGLDRKNKTAFFQQLVKTRTTGANDGSASSFEFPTGSFSRRSICSVAAARVLEQRLWQRAPRIVGDSISIVPSARCQSRCAESTRALRCSTCIGSLETAGWNKSKNLRCRRLRQWSSAFYELFEKMRFLFFRSRPIEGACLQKPRAARR